MTLAILNLTVQSGGRVIAEDVSLSVEPGKVTAVLGPNGAGKSEIVLAIAGMEPILSGTITADGVDLTGKKPDVIRAAGVAAVPEGHAVLTELSVDDNLRAAGSLAASELEDNLASVYELFPELAERKSQLAGSLSGGQQQMVAIGHALVAKPKYVLIDEMSLGLAPLIVKRLMTVVSTLKQQGVGIILIEQFTELALSIAEQAIVLRNGKVRFSGAAKELRDNQKVLDRAYFGTERS
jgi:branched-chain amino acid transport system ATP-binding protein